MIFDLQRVVAVVQNLMGMEQREGYPTRELIESIVDKIFLIFNIPQNDGEREAVVRVLETQNITWMPDPQVHGKTPDLVNVRLNLGFQGASLSEHSTPSRGIRLELSLSYPSEGSPEATSMEDHEEEGTESQNIEEVPHATNPGQAVYKDPITNLTEDDLAYKLEDIKDLITGFTGSHVDYPAFATNCEEALEELIDHLSCHVSYEPD